jgi:hypothetical protein
MPALPGPGNESRQVQVAWERTAAALLVRVSLALVVLIGMRMNPVLTYFSKFPEQIVGCVIAFTRMWGQSHGGCSIAETQGDASRDARIKRVCGLEYSFVSPRDSD